MKKYLPKTISAILFIFGLITLFLSSSVILDLFDIRVKEGNYVLFVVWANFLSSIIYLFAAYGLLKNKNWTILLLSTATLILGLALLGLFIYISNGGLYETKTVGVMVFRTSLTLIFTLISYFTINTKKQLS